MISPLKKSHTVTNTVVLLPSWMRRADTTPLDDLAMAAGFIPAGPKRLLHRRLITAIDSAQEVILMASFLFADHELADALERAATRGVRVYMLNASEHRLRTLDDGEERFDQKMAEEHKALLDRLVGKVLLRSAEHFHAKFLVTDPHMQGRRAWISTANFNKALHDGIELALEFEGDEATALAGWFNYAFWLEAERELVGKGRLNTVATPPAEPQTPPACAIKVTSGKHRDLRDSVLRLIAGAQRSIIVSSYGLEKDHATTAGLIAAIQRGVSVIIATRPRPAVKDACEALAAAGATIVAHEKLHAKAVCADDEAILMTANLATDGLDSGFEVGVTLAGEQAMALRAILGNWVARFPWRFELKPVLAEDVSETCPAHLPFRDSKSQPPRENTVKIVPKLVEKLPPVAAADALNLEAAKTPALQSDWQRNGHPLPRRIQYEWEVRPPRLPEKAKERKREVVQKSTGKDGKPVEHNVTEPFQPPVFDLNGRAFVMLRDLNDIEAARALAAELNATIVVR